MPAAGFPALAPPIKMRPAANPTGSAPMSATLPLTARAPRKNAKPGTTTSALLRWFRGQTPPARPAPAAPVAAEAARIEALSHYDILDTEAEPQFDLIARLASELTGSPVAVLNLIAADRVWTKAAVGVPRGGAMGRDQAYCSLVIDSPEGLHIVDLRADPRTRDLPLTADKGYIMYSGVPLRSSCGQPIGTLAVLDSIPRRLTDRQLDWLEQLAQQAMALLELRRKQRELQQAQDELKRLASTDALTGLLNRRAWDEAAALEAERRARWGEGHAVIALDLDHFKQVNDTHGHAAGDAVLKAVGGLLAQSFRKLDTVARVGGEEFAVLLPHTTAADTAVLAGQLRAAIGALRIPFGPLELRITASIGVAHSDEAADVQALADARSYAAKRGGRNRVVSDGGGAGRLAA
jgi:diguanylate cyclase (GGDEF)-like protein